MYVVNINRIVGMVRFITIKAFGNTSHILQQHGTNEKINTKGWVVNNVDFKNITLIVTLYILLSFLIIIGGF